MSSIAIVGAGVAGLHLGLYLQHHGIEATLYTDRSPDEVRAGRLLNTVQLQESALARDRAVGVGHWRDLDHYTRYLHLHVPGEPPLAVRGAGKHPFLFIDMRLYLPRLLEDFAGRGGRVVQRALDADGVARLADEHDLVVVATGRAGLADLFPRVAERSPYAAPQRWLCGGLVRGIAPLDEPDLPYHLVPEHGEILEMRFLTAQGLATAFLIEATPGGAFEPVARMRYQDDPAAFDRALCALLLEYAPLTAPRIDRDAFGVTGALDILSGALTPIGRRAYATLGNGRTVLGLGDVQATFDPLTGQGANMASRTAWMLGEALVARLRAEEALDEAFCADIEQRMWESLRPVMEWTNAFLQPPPPHAVSLLVAAAQNQAIADAYVDNFNHPERHWEALATPAATEAFLARFEKQA